MILQNITDKLVSKFCSDESLNLSQQSIVGQSPMSSIRSSLQSIVNYFDTSQSKYDAIGFAAATTDELIDNAIDRQMLNSHTMSGEVLANWEEYVIPIDNESAKVIASALSQILDGSTSASISDSAGRVYKLVASDVMTEGADFTGSVSLEVHTSFGDVFSYPFLYRGGSINSWHLNTIMLPINFSSNKTDILNCKYNLSRNMSEESFEATNVFEVLSVAYFGSYPNEEWNQRDYMLECIVDQCSESGIDYPDDSPYSRDSDPFDVLKWIFEEQGVGPGSIESCLYELVIKVPLSGIVVFPNTTLNVLTDVGLSGLLNSVLRGAAQSALNGSINSYVQSILDTYPSAHGYNDRLRTIAGQIKRANAESGVRGVLSYLLEFFRSAQSIQENNGVLAFTDNNSLVPAEFIAGVVTSVVQSVLQMASLVLAMIRTVWTIVLSVLTAAASAIVSVFTQAADDTRASVTTPSGFDDATILPVLPLSVLRGEFAHSDATYSDLMNAYRILQGPLYLPVPGGLLFIGPGAFSQSGKVTLWRYEFHPYARYFDADESHTLPEYLRLNSGSVDIQWESTSSNTLWMYNHVFSDAYIDTLNSFIISESYPIGGVYDNATGILSENMDYGCRLATICFIAIFIGWISWHTAYNYGGYDYFVGPSAPADLVNAHGANFFMRSFIQIMLYDFWPVGYGTYTWAHIANACGDICDNSAVMTQASFNEGWTEYHLASDRFPANSFFINNGLTAATIYQDFYNHVYGTAVPIPASYKYSLLLPKYNSSTFWSYAFLAGVISVGIIAVVAAVAVGYKRLSIHRRALNKRLFDNRKTTFENALDGRIERINEEGEVVYDEFDTTSTEGRAYIKSCWKSYRRQALKNNIWANLVGGSRYDVSSFWGEKESDSSTNDSGPAGLISYLGDNSDIFSSETDSTDTSSASVFDIMKLITG